jgi:hypothetical protein
VGAPLARHRLFRHRHDRVRRHGPAPEHLRRPASRHLGGLSGGCRRAGGWLITLYALGVVIGAPTIAGSSRSIRAIA